MNSKRSKKVKSVDPDELTYPGLDCQITNTNIYYVGVHAITKNEFDELIRAYFSRTYKEPVTIPIDVSKSSCYDYIEWDNRNTNIDNTDLIVQLKASKIITGKYSVHFFRGLGKLFPSAYAFQFSKAYNNIVKADTVVIRVIDAGKNPLYHGDLTHMYP